jgi:hypothetical protein
VYFFERVYLSITAKPKPLTTPLPMVDARALWRFIQTELNTPWPSWQWMEPQLLLTDTQMDKLPLIELNTGGKKIC